VCIRAYGIGRGSPRPCQWPDPTSTGAFETCDGRAFRDIRHRAWPAPDALSFLAVDYLELAAVFNGPHPETGEELVVADEPVRGVPGHDLPAQPAVFAPDYAPEEIAEIAAKLRSKAGRPKEPTGEVATGNGRRSNGEARTATTRAKRRRTASACS
jgi:hypothetical protein